MHLLLHFITCAKSCVLELAALSSVRGQCGNGYVCLLLCVVVLAMEGLCVLELGHAWKWKNVCGFLSCKPYPCARTRRVLAKVLVWVLFLVHGLLGVAPLPN